MRITGNLVYINPYGRRTVPQLAKHQFKIMADHHAFNYVPSSAVNSQARNNTCKVYLKTDDMLFSGGNGTGLSFYIKYAENSTADNPVLLAKGVDENGNELFISKRLTRITLRLLK